MENTPNPSKTGLGENATGGDQPNCRGALTDPAWSGRFGMDQSVETFTGPRDAPSSQRDNHLPPVPSIIHGVR